MSQMPDIDSLLEADEKNVREMQKLFAGCQGLPELLNEAVVLYKTCNRAFGQALSQEISGLPHDLPLDNSSYRADFVTKHQRGLLFARIGVLYATAVADLLRMRLTAPLGYVRLQCESIALLKLMSENPSIVQQWVKIETDKQGKDFFQQYQKRVMAILSTTIYHIYTTKPLDRLSTVVLSEWPVGINPNAVKMVSVFLRRTVLM